MKARVALPAGSAIVRKVDADTAYWRRVERIRASFYRPTRDRVRKQFERESTAVSDALRESQDPYRALDSQRDGWERLLTATYLAVGSEVAKFKAEMFGLRSRSVRATSFDDLFAAWMREHMGAKISGIDDTTRDSIRKALEDGLALGEDMYQLADRIEALYLEDIIPHRSMLIAQNEVMTANNVASFLSTKALADEHGLEVTKTWITARDGRVRDGPDADHVAMDGVTVPLDEPFVVDGFEMMFPRDDSRGAPRREILNCRCIIRERIVE